MIFNLKLLLRLWEKIFSSTLSLKHDMERPPQIMTVNDMSFVTKGRRRTKRDSCKWQSTRHLKWILKTLTVNTHFFWWCWWLLYKSDKDLWCVSLDAFLSLSAFWVVYCRQSMTWFQLTRDDSKEERQTIHSYLLLHNRIIRVMILKDRSQPSLHVTYYWIVKR